ncbi:hypothetical protein DICPUDRAFT_77659 [Dictyostelium purpureum]|uniref:Uncharacterized protein n=1 Tax=Dictyostelium purpureum TaxID=5786 RepID=F0ZH94_DICPU|nr:uncharacterized protein DICPUDRAFT_77659 [Dictyostelium purpureum]EGC36685.1 hypothetical protein DICPUDRAFT_77659 [Dictyostelium purpureum]|eukprot:XP_003286784.1 hypothetical protein DICPUDRAFT_77659 [Dictyostelium purpureum]
MNVKYCLVLIVCMILTCGFVNNINADCNCNGATKIVNSNDPNVLSEDVVKIFAHWDLNGSVFLYNKTDGYIQLPDEFRNNVQSFQSGIDVCFIKWYPREQVQIHAGDYHKNYAALTNFGQRMDGLYAGLCSDVICPISK